MDKIGFVTTPLTSGHAVRGIGIYTKLLLENLQKLQNNNFEIVPIKDNSQLSTLNSQLSLLHYPFFDLFAPTLFPSPVPTVVTIHDVIPLRFVRQYPAGIKGQLNLLKQKTALSRATAVITDSQTSRRDIIRYLGVNPAKISVIPLAPQFVNSRRPAPKSPAFVRQKYDLPEKFVLYVGDVNWNKNIPNLVKACRLKKMPLVIVGKQALDIDTLSSGPASLTRPRDLIRILLKRPHPQLAHLATLKELFKDPTVARLGFVPAKDLRDIYRLATVYCQPSFWEGFGLDPLEAITCGCPVVASNTPALKELLGKAAVFVNPDDYRAIASGLGVAIKKRLFLTKLGRQRAKAYNWAKTASQVLSVYRKALADL